MIKRIPDLETAIQRIYKLEERIEKIEGQVAKKEDLRPWLSNLQDQCNGLAGALLRVEARLAKLEGQIKELWQQREVDRLVMEWVRDQYSQKGQKQPECTCGKKAGVSGLCSLCLAKKILNHEDPKTATEAVTVGDVERSANAGVLWDAKGVDFHTIPLNAQVHLALGHRVIYSKLYLDWIDDCKLCCSKRIIPDYLDPANALRAFWTYIIQNHLSAKIHIDPLGSGSIEISGGIVVNFENFATARDYCLAIVEDYKRRKG